MLQYLDPRSVAANVRVDDWRGAVSVSGQLLLDADAVEESYVAAMLRTIEQMGPYAVIAPGIAIPHARPEDGARRIALSVTQLSYPIEFGSERNDPVDLLFGFATTDPDGHVDLLQALADFIEKGDLNSIRQARTAEDILAAFQEVGTQEG